MRVAVVQYAAGSEPAENRRILRQLALEAVAAADGVDLVVAPEAAQVGFGQPDQPLGPLAESLDGPFVDALRGVAAEAGATVVAGMFERVEAGTGGGDGADGRVHNTLVAVDRAGAVAATYRKTHLYDAFGVRESDRFVPGPPRPVTVAVGAHRVGLLTCYDLRFPEFARLLADDGADVLAVPAAWHRGPLKEDHWTTLVRARAIENTCYVAAAAQPPPSYCGRSMLVDPMGVVLASLGEEAGWCGGEVRPERLTDVRRRNPTLDHRRVRLVADAGPKAATDGKADEPAP